MQNFDGEPSATEMNDMLVNFNKIINTQIAHKDILFTIGNGQYD